MIYGFETAPARNSASAAVRRKNLIDTNNNAGQNDGPGDFISLNYSSSGISDEELSVRRPRNSREGSWNPFLVPPNPPVPPPVPTGNKHLIFQIGAATDGNINRSFVELYNNADTPLDLTGYSLQYAEGTRHTPTAIEDQPWQIIDFELVIPDPAKRIIPPQHSFLILGEAQIPEPGVSPALTFEDGYGDLNISGFHISNRSYKVVLVNNTTLLTVQNPFGLDGVINVAGDKISGYVDMVGAMNTVGEDKINGFEYLPITNLNKHAGQRRTSLIDTDNNRADFARATFAGAAPLEFERLRPKNLAYGEWDPFAVPQLPPTEALMILQVGASAAGAIGRSFIELYNNTDTPINLSTYSLQYAAGTSRNQNITEFADWEIINLTGTIPAKGSYLVVGEITITSPGSGTDGRLQIDMADQVIYDFLLSNRGFKVALMANQNKLTVDNPFDVGGGEKAEGFVDLLGAINTADTQTQVNDNINAFKTSPAVVISQQAAARRGSLTDTDNNSADFVRVDYRTVVLDKFRPRSSVEGAWIPEF
jgi:hypothetical protein